ncbi:unnamed protein product [Phytophthora fragariaefolia]|uniref:Unnamed protein product n=1 Tax=Phytophthora fragariaefolia TaxID=1490495 RepID=A0A9W6Y3T5_9STRA|nr:unnamed protein product [Phytophthora fragariaefolia]
MVSAGMPRDPVDRPHAPTHSELDIQPAEAAHLPIGEKPGAGQHDVDMGIAVATSSDQVAAPSSHGNLAAVTATPRQDEVRPLPFTEDIDVDIGDQTSPQLGPRPASASDPQLAETPGQLYQTEHSPSSETDPSQEPYWHQASPVSQSLRGNSGFVAATPSLEDQEAAVDVADSPGFTLEKVVPPAHSYGLNYQEWIGSLQGVPVAVPANSQCLVLAFYATVMNTFSKKLALSATIVAAADVVKQRVLDIVLANLRYDVKLNLVSAKEEFQRIYPDDAPPSSVEACAATLFAHYTKMKAISVATPVSFTFWEGPTVLRAMAVYLRETIYVWDIGADDMAYAQQYAYRTFQMDNGDSHETGVVTALSEGTVRGFLEACFNHHVIPTMLLLKHREGHFYGVQHDTTFHDWHTQQGPEMRVRLDLVQSELGFPILPSEGYDPESVTVEAAQEEQALLKEMGVDFYASGSQESLMTEPSHPVLTRAPVDITTTVHKRVYLPYPELAAQSCQHEQLIHWGEREAYQHQVLTIERIRHDEDSDDVAQTFCTGWLEHCYAATPQDAIELARDRQMWSELGTMVDVSLLPLRPLNIPLEHWFILHVLPYAIKDWDDTSMGRAPTSSRAIWYQEYQPVQQLCTAIADRRDWSIAVWLPLGLTRTDLPAIAVPTTGRGPTARRKYRRPSRPHRGGPEAAHPW